MTPPKTRTVYLLQYVDWRYNDDYTVPAEVTPVEAFVDRQTAVRRARELTNLRLSSGLFESNPFEFNTGEWEQITSKTEAQMVRHFVQLDLPPPSKLPAGERTKYDWTDMGWWFGVVQTLHDRPREYAAFWEAFDRVQFFEVIETTWQE